jgi:hypothetical protein
MLDEGLSPYEQRYNTLARYWNVFLVCVAVYVILRAWLYAFVVAVERTIPNVDIELESEVLAEHHDIPVELYHHVAITSQAMQKTSELGRHVAYEARKWFKERRPTWAADRYGPMVSRAVAAMYETTPHQLYAMSHYGRSYIVSSIWRAHRYLTDGLVPTVFGGRARLPSK